MEFDGIAEGCQLGDCLIRPNPKRSMKNWRNNDGPSCAQKSAGMGGIGWGGVQMRFPRRFSAASHWVGQSGVLVGRLHFRMPTLQSLILIFFNFFKFAPFPSLCRVTSCQEGCLTAATSTRQPHVTCATSTRHSHPTAKIKKITVLAAFALWQDRGSARTSPRAG